MRIFISDVETLIQEDLAALTEPIQTGFGSAEHAGQRNRIEQVQRLSLELQAIARQKCAHMLPGLDEDQAINTPNAHTICKK